MFSNLKLRVKIGLGYGVVVLILMVVGTYAYLTFQRANAQWDSLESNEIAKKDLIFVGNQALGNAVQSLKYYLCAGGIQ